MSFNEAQIALLKKMRMVDLRDIAKTSGIKGYSRLNKAQLAVCIDSHKSKRGSSCSYLSASAKAKSTRKPVVRKSPAKPSAKSPAKRAAKPPAKKAAKPVARKSPAKPAQKGDAYDRIKHQNVLDALYRTKLYLALPSNYTDAEADDIARDTYGRIVFKPLTQVRELIREVDASSAKARGLSLVYFIRKDNANKDVLDSMNKEQLIKIWYELMNRKARVSTHTPRPPPKKEDIRTEIRSMEGNQGPYPWVFIKVPKKYVPPRRAPRKKYVPPPKVASPSASESSLIATNFWREMMGKSPLKSAR